MEMTIDRIGDVAAVAVPVDELDASNASELKRDIAPVLQANTKAGARSEPRAVHGQLGIGRDAVVPAAAHRQEGRSETVRDVQAGPRSLRAGAPAPDLRHLRQESGGGARVPIQAGRRCVIAADFDQPARAPLQVPVCKRPSSGTSNTRWARRGGSFLARAVRGGGADLPGSDGRAHARNRGALPARRSKRLYYLSIEFLPGQYLGNNLLNLGIREPCREALRNLGADLDEIEASEPDPALGNGGLGPPGRLPSGLAGDARYCPASATASTTSTVCSSRKSITDTSARSRRTGWPEGTPWQIARAEEACMVPLRGRIEHSVDRKGGLQPHVDGLEDPHGNSA